MKLKTEPLPSSEVENAWSYNSMPHTSAWGGAYLSHIPGMTLFCSPC
jgi:hypothetical protein